MLDSVDRSRAALAARLHELLEPRNEVLEAYLFGSVARGSAQGHSDIDVAVYVDRARCADGTFGYQAEITSVLMTGLGNNSVDVVILNHAPPLLYHRVLRDGLRFLARNLKATTAREARAVSRYCDYIPQLDKIDGARRSRVEDPAR
jgi:predicted nucleotidyltransferase